MIQERFFSHFNGFAVCHTNYQFLRKDQCLKEDPLDPRRICISCRTLETCLNLLESKSDKHLKGFAVRQQHAFKMGILNPFCITNSCFAI